MPARKSLTPQYATPQATDPYYGDYSALAQQFLKSKNHPVYSAGQGIADVLGGVGEAYFERKALDKAKAQQTGDTSNYAMAQRIAMQPDMSKMDAISKMAPTGMSENVSPANSIFNTGATGNERAAAATGQLNNRNAVAYGPDIAALAKQFAPPSFTGKLGEGESAFIDGNPVASGAPKPTTQTPHTVTTADGVYAQKPDGTLGVRLGDAPRQNEEPLIQIPDPKDPTRAILVPRSQAAGQVAFQTPRERAFKMQTYFDEDGRQIQLDSNDPKDQETIRQQGLVTAGPSDAERTSKGYLDRMLAAEGEIKGLLDKNPKILTSFKDNAASKLPFGNALVSDDYRQLMQKVKDWTRAKLRKESGAVIGDKEAVDELKTYFGEYGDDPGTQKGKEGSRNEAMRQMATTAGLLGRKTLRQITAGGNSPDGVDPALWAHMTPEEKALWK